MFKFLCFICRWTWRLLIVLVLFLNFRLYWPTPLAQDDHQIGFSLCDQLKANGRELTTGTPERMQGLFPEGFYFCHALHGLTWIEAAQRDPALTSEALKNAKLAYQNLDSEECRSTFPAELPPDHGAFYSAWKAHLLGGIVMLQKGQNADDLAALERECDAWADVLRESKSPFFQSYRGGVWPCDTIPAIHAMKTFDRVTTGDKYQSSVNKWLTDVKLQLDPTTGLMPHSNLADGDQTGQGRATSQMIILRLLPDIDEAFARSQYKRFRDQFLTTFGGIPCLFEYANGQGASLGDVDTGPLIFGRSLSATVFMIGTAQIYHERPVANAIAQAGEAVGLPWTMNQKKRYVAGVLPIGDIMVAYSQNAKRWSDGDGHCPEQPALLSPYWRLKVHLYSSLLLLPLVVLRLRKRNGVGIQDVER